MNANANTCSNSEQSILSIAQSIAYLIPKLTIGEITVLRDLMLSQQCKLERELRTFLTTKTE